MRGGTMRSNEDDQSQTWDGIYLPPCLPALQQLHGSHRQLAPHFWPGQVEQHWQLPAGQLQLDPQDCFWTEYWVGWLAEQHPEPWVWVGWLVEQHPEDMTKREWVALNDQIRTFSEDQWPDGDRRPLKCWVSMRFSAKTGAVRKMVYKLHSVP